MTRRTHREGLRLSLEDEFDVYIAANIAEAEEILKNETIDVMLTDLRPRRENGMDLITRALARPKPPICILMTAYGSVDVAVEAMKKGAYDYVSKPLNIDELEIVIKRAIRSRAVEAEVVALKSQVSDRYGLENIIGRSAVMKPVFETIRQVAPTRATVLIEGESGTGKELVAAPSIISADGRSPSSSRCIAPPSANSSSRAKLSDTSAAPSPGDGAPHRALRGSRRRHPFPRRNRRDRPQHPGEAAPRHRRTDNRAARLETNRSRSTSRRRRDEQGPQ